MSQNNPDNIQSVQVVPICEDHVTGEIHVHANGPNEETTGWAVYLRKENGEAMWVADVGTEKDADFIGNGYAKHLGVEIEPQPWKNKAE
jgi:hypothetical protein